MLSPFKTFLNNLQKNAGATIFGLSSPNATPAADDDVPADATDAAAAVADNGSTDQGDAAPGVDATTTAVAAPSVANNNNQVHDHIDDDATTSVLSHCSAEAAVAAEAATTTTNDPPTFQLADDQLSQQSCDDPLSDPLALEDNCSQFDDELSPTMRAVDAEDADAAAASADNTEITLVDVSRLTENEPASSVADSMPSAMEFDEAVADLVGLVPDDATCVEEGGVRSDGSDSGLGLESSALLQCEPVSNRPPIAPTPRQPLRTALKRRSDTIPDPNDSFDDVVRVATSNMNTGTGSSTTAKRPKRNIHFNDVIVYYFQRQQGFMCVPSQGGCSLGMAATHMYRRRFTLAEYAAEQRRVQRHKAQELKRSAGLPVSSSEDSAGASDDECGGGGGAAELAATGIPSGASVLCSSTTTTTNDLPTSDSDDTESLGIQPVSARQRRVMLKAAGVRKIDAAEKRECRDILLSRDNCGCNCRGFCDPETCACAQSGIKCQVDRLHYPCGCTRDGCGNPVGRAEFNKARVKTHYIHTFLRLQLESKHPPSPLQHPSPVVLPPMLPALSRPPVDGSTMAPMLGTIGGWHSQVGRSLAAMSGDNLYNMNGATTTTMLAPSLQLDQTPDLHYAYGDEAYDAVAMSGGTNGTTSVGQFDCFIASTTASSSSSSSLTGRGSGLNTPTNICGSPSTSAFAVLTATAASSLYSPDSASIVEPTATEPTSAIHAPHSNYPPKYPTADDINASTNGTCSTQSTASSASLYPDFGNITGYQHSYLYSLQQQQEQHEQLHAEHDPSVIGGSADQHYQHQHQHHSTTNTGYQHSYLYSLMQHKSGQRTANMSGPDHDDDDDDNDAGPLSACKPSASRREDADPNTTSTASLDERLDLELEFDVDYTGSTAGILETAGLTSLDELLGVQSATAAESSLNGEMNGGGSGGDSSQCAFDLEPIDFENELGLATTFIDKSLKACVSPSLAAIAAQSDVVALMASNGHHSDDDTGE